MTGQVYVCFNISVSNDRLFQVRKEQMKILKKGPQRNHVAH
jgi:hypothetical protein